MSESTQHQSSRNDTGSGVEAPGRSIDFESLRRKLLDLTARNRLLHYTHPKRTSLRVIDELPDVLAGKLLDGEELSFLPVPEPTKQQLIKAGYIEIDTETEEETQIKPYPRAIDWARHMGLKTDYELPSTEGNVKEAQHYDNRIQTVLYPSEVEAQLRAIFGAANLSINETGANILYLALGFLEWHESDDSKVARLAPLFLIPAHISRGNLDKRLGVYVYTLKHSGDEILSNLSLREKLRADYGLALPELDPETTPEKYFKAVSTLLKKHKPNWALHRYATLGLFNFSKLLLYLDLDPSRWPSGDRNILEHPVVSRFIHASGAEAPESAFAVEHDIDSLKDIHERYPVIFDADSSQHSALIDAIRGENLVIEGPPGTGKSQTITNLIAAALANGKSVLFVAEKLAALEVVKRRLDQADLGEFCLELHSNKAQKKAVLDDLASRIESRPRVVNISQVESEIARYEHLRGELSNYARLINEHWKNTSRSIHFILSRAAQEKLSLGEGFPEFEIASVTGESFSLENAASLNDRFKQYVGAAEKIVSVENSDETLSSHPWYGVENADLNFMDRDRVVTLLQKWHDDLAGLGSNYENACRRFGIEAPETISVDAIVVLRQNASAIADHQKVTDLGFLRKLTIEDIDKLDEMTRLLVKVSQNRKVVRKTLDEKVLDDSSVAVELGGKADLVHELGGPGAANRNLADLSSSVANARQAMGALMDVLGILADVRSSRTGVPDSVTEPSIGGIEGFVEFAGFAAELPSRLLKYRGLALDSEEVDSTIAECRGACEKALELVEASDVHVDPGNLPDLGELRSTQQALSDDSILRYFRSPWRKARKWVRANLREDAFPKSDLKSAIGAAVSAAEAIHALNDHTEWAQTFGGLFQGTDTPLSDIETLRNWLRRVRRRYGVGFGLEVGVGNALTEMGAQPMTALRSVSEQGVLDQAIESLDHLKSLGNSFPKLTLFHGDKSGQLDSSSGSRDQIEQLAVALDTLNRHVLKNDVPLGDLKLQLTRTSEIFADLATATRLNETLSIPQDLRLGYPFTRRDGERLAELRNVLGLLKAFSAQPYGPTLKLSFDRNPSPEFFRTLSDTAVEIEGALEVHRLSAHAFSDLTSLNLANWSRDHSVRGLCERASRALVSATRFDDWTDFLRQRGYFDALGYTELLTQVETRSVELADAEKAFEYLNYASLAREIFRENEQLAGFTGEQLGTIQSQFKECDQALSKLQCKKIASQISKRPVPQGSAGGRVSEYTGLALIQHEIGKKARHLPIRGLVRRAGESVLGLKPCFMMSPMSVAQYLEPGALQFDLVVMDEASQIRPEDALGAIARGGQLVVVGDPKQLPPTSFFDRVIDEDEDEDEIAIRDSGSILDAALPIFRGRRLRWHYRSRHESLIRFSNEHFYNNDLVVFPSPNTSSNEFGVKYQLVRKGRFVSRRNIEEAQLIAETLAKHILERPKESVGVVSMNSEQREQIDRCFEQLVKDNPALQDALAVNLNSTEPVFIKNLENVQGDERDVMFLSMTYGPSDAGGRVYQRFGPINSDVGWRRLNVLFTRAKKRMHVFTSMRPEDVLVSGGSSKGVVALRQFLGYAERGYVDDSRPTGKEPDSDFEVSVAHALRSQGFECVPQVGVAGFYIDIGVTDPHVPGRFLLGVECDGASYHSGKSVRDRDRLRQAILEQLGWKIRRVWSTDWFRDPQSCITSLIGELTELAGVPPPPIEERAEVAVVSDLEEQETEEVDEVGRFTSSGESLRKQLEAFDREVIQAALPDTLISKRLLRPAMIEALCNFRPATKAEFSQMIPRYLREETEAREGVYLSRVLDIVVASEG